MEQGCDITIRNQAGETPKDVAKRYAQMGAVELLGGEIGKLFITWKIFISVAKRVRTFFSTPVLQYDTTITYKLLITFIYPSPNIFFTIYQPMK